MNLDALNKHRYISLTTYRRDGRGVATPVWFAIDGGRIVVWTDADSGKAKRIRATHRVTVAPSDARGKVTGDAFEGAARILPDGESASAMRALNKKYSLLKPVIDLGNRAFAFVRRRPMATEILLAITPAQ
jgi:PPOX class probable F420-dependent enzyme